jgi:hypothetical protein
MSIDTIATERRLTHVELLYRPGQRQLAAEVLRLLGCVPVDRGGTWFTSFIDPAGVGDYANNALYASEVSKEQWRLEQAMASTVAVPHAEYVALMRREPQRSAHFGFRVPEESALENLVSDVRKAGADDPELAGRVGIDGVYRPGEPGAIAPNMVQAFVWTDVVATGLLSLGQHIELQWHLPV